MAAVPSLFSLNGFGFAQLHCCSSGAVLVNLKAHSCPISFDVLVHMVITLLISVLRIKEDLLLK